MTDDSSPPVAALLLAPRFGEAKLEPGSPRSPSTEAADLEEVPEEIVAEVSDAEDAAAQPHADDAAAQPHADDAAEQPAADFAAAQPAAEDTPRQPVVRIAVPQEPGSPGDAGEAADSEGTSPAFLAAVMNAASSPAESASFFIGDEEEDEASNEEHDQDQKLPELDCPDDALMELLSSYGFAVDAATRSWRQNVRQPRLLVRVTGHAEYQGHTRYTMDCELVPLRGDVTVRWTASKRLAHIRKYLHDAVKEALGDKVYEVRFGGTAFAKKGGLWGTTRRLDAWCGSLTACISDKKLPAALAAQILMFLEAPCESHILALAGNSVGNVPESDSV